MSEEGTSLSIGELIGLLARLDLEVRVGVMLGVVRTIVSAAGNVLVAEEGLLN